MAHEPLGNCPVCGGDLSITEYACEACGTSIRGAFSRCDLCALPPELMHFVRVFLKSEGNFKQVERELGISYPTVKARLQKINDRLAMEGFSDFVKSRERVRVLEEFREGRMSKQDLLDWLKDK